MFYVQLLFSKNCAMYEIMWKNMAQLHRPEDDTIIWRMCFACWITKAAETGSKCVILIAFPWQQWLCEHASILHYLHIACLVHECNYTE
jgi:hypothetical protein